MIRYKELADKYQKIKDYFNTQIIPIPEPLLPLKESIDTFEFPHRKDKDLWTKLKALHTTFDKILPVIEKSAQGSDQSETLNQTLMNCRSLVRFIVQCEGDILSDFFNTYVDDSNSHQLDKLYTNYVIPRQETDDEASITKAIAMKMFDPEFRAQYNIEGQVIDNILDGSIRKLEELGGVISDIIEHVKELP